MKDILIISDYDMGYNFSVLWNGKIYSDPHDELWNICFRYSTTPDFETMRVYLKRIGIIPNDIIICSDGCIYTEK